jgi:hypothetical protein
MALFALLIGFLGYPSLKSSEPWRWPDLYFVILPAIAAGGVLIGVPFFATQEREDQA